MKLKISESPIGRRALNALEAGKTKFDEILEYVQDETPADAFAPSPYYVLSVLSDLCKSGIVRKIQDEYVTGV